MKIKDIAEHITSGQIISRVESQEEVGDEVIEIKSVLIPKAISNGRVVHSDLGSVKLKKMVDPERVTKTGDIIFKLSTPYDSVIIEQEDEGLVVPSFCVVIRGINNERVDAHFVAAYINTDYVRQILKSKVAGTSMPMIKLSDVKDLEIPDVTIDKQRLLGKAYQIYTDKQVALKELLANEQELMDNLILKAVKDVI